MELATLSGERSRMVAQSMTSVRLLDTNWNLLCPVRHTGRCLRACSRPGLLMASCKQRGKGVRLRMHLGPCASEPARRQVKRA